MLTDTWDRITSFVKSNWKYIWPSVIAPVALFHAVGFIETIIWMIELGIVLYMTIMACGMMVGIYCGIIVKYKRDDADGGLINLRICSIIPTIKWGNEIAQWALEDIDENRT